MINLNIICSFLILVLYYNKDIIKNIATLQVFLLNICIPISIQIYYLYVKWTITENFKLSKIFDIYESSNCRDALPLILQGCQIIMKFIIIFDIFHYENQYGFGKQLKVKHSQYFILCIFL